MQSLTCPNCNKSFEIDEKGYAAIREQVRSAEFEKEVSIVKERYKESLSRMLREQQEKHDEEIKKMEDVIAQYKDFKIRLDNKSLGESLEQYCQHKFDEIRGLLPDTVVFEKDNIPINGSKGDFIYRETDKEETNVLSIMFEMKTEFDDSSNKKKNADHLAKLDKDRNQKDCEYAVLVTTLEADNDYYNNGIVKAPGNYDKMYVVRPQCFLTIISILRNAAMSSLEYKRTIAALEKEQADVTGFEDALDKFKDDFNTSVVGAGKNFNDAIAEINKAIDGLVKVRDQLLENCGKQLNAAVNKVDKLTIKKLTKGRPEVKKLFDELPSDED